jgi:hypothetical protein
LVFTKVAEPQPRAVAAVKARISANLRATLLGDEPVGRIGIVMNLGDIYTDPLNKSYDWVPLFKRGP